MTFACLPALLSLLAPQGFAGVGDLVLRARVLDESGAAVVSREIWYGIECDEPVPGSNPSAGFVGGTASTDASGVLRIALGASENSGIARTLRLTLAQHDLAQSAPAVDSASASALQQMLDEGPQPPRIRPPYAECALPAGSSIWEWDLGDQVLRAPGSPAKFAGLDDARLCAHYLELLAISDRTQVAKYEALDELLCEFVRRATPTCESFIATRLELAHREPSGLGFQGDLADLALLTALRRIQHRPDPVVIALNSEQAVETTFPRFPTLAFALRNGDSQGAAVNLVPALLAYGLDGVGPGGAALAASRWAPRGYSGGGSPVVLAHGNALPATRAAANWLRMTAPGEYRLRLTLLPATNPSVERDLRGHIALQSPEVRVIIRPLRIRLSHTEHDQHLAWLRAIDAAKTIVVLTHDSVTKPVDPLLRPNGDWSGPADDPEDRLYRSGLRSLPALFDELDDPALDPIHRAWAVAMLWNLTGVRECGFEGVGRIRECTQWPTVRTDGPIGASRGGYRSEPLHEARLARTIERWKPYRSFVEIEWTD